MSEGFKKRSKSMPTPAVTGSDQSAEVEHEQDIENPEKVISGSEALAVAIESSTPIERKIKELNPALQLLLSPEQLEGGLINLIWTYASENGELDISEVSKMYKLTAQQKQRLINLFKFSGRFKIGVKQPVIIRKLR